jgi:uncharacterized membrane protein (DUF373 family)
MVATEKTVEKSMLASQDAAMHPAIPHTQIHLFLRRTLEHAQDVIIVVLMALLIGITARALWQLFDMAFLHSTEYPVLLSHVVFVLILTELYRTLVFYLREHRVSVALMVEVTIVSTLQDVILKNAHEFEWHRILGNAVLLIVLGGLLALERRSGRARHAFSDTSAH